MGQSEKIGRWYDEVEHEIAKRWPENPPIEISTVLALIAVESHGDPYARDPLRKKGQFWGLLQQGIDVSNGLGHPKRFPKWKTSSYLHGEPEKAIREFLEQMERSDHNHGWAPDLIAIQWKGGGGTVRTWNRLVDRGLNPANQFPFNNENEWQFGVPVYLKRFRTAERDWHDWSPPAALVGANGGGDE